MRGTAFTWRYTTNHLCAISNRLFRMESTLTTRETLTNDFSVFIDKNRHYLPSAAATTF
ncbi:Uncharacterised protein [Vibrio cholerae]|uniref:Uncharacterized protein n=1 Tax=Vibrio cholerae TaxID=666 RepID=A0A655Y047_VIBCL|nr:Uncharacterised protein [Vibrio cholerae]